MSSKKTAGKAGTVAGKNASRDRAATEAKLLAAGRRVFARDGYAGASVREIARLADSNVSLINRYFGGKEGLLLRIVEAFIRRKQDGALGYPPCARLADEIFEYLKFRRIEDEANADLIRILIPEMTVNPDFRARVLAAASTESDANFRERLARLQTDGEIPPDVDLDDLFQIVGNLSFSLNFVGQILLERSPAESERIFREFAQTYSAGLHTRRADS